MTVLPRNFASSILRPLESVRITIEPPLTDTEQFLVLNIDPNTRNAIDIDERAPGHAVIRNKTDRPIPYFFVVLPIVYIRLLKADWTSLKLFLTSLKALADSRQTQTANPPVKS